MRLYIFILALVLYHSQLSSAYPPTYTNEPPPSSSTTSSSSASTSSAALPSSSVTLATTLRASADSSGDGSGNVGSGNNSPQQFSQQQQQQQPKQQQIKNHEENVQQTPLPAYQTTSTKAAAATAAATTLKEAKEAKEANATTVEKSLDSSNSANVQPIFTYQAAVPVDIEGHKQQQQQQQQKKQHLHAKLNDDSSSSIEVPKSSVHLNKNNNNYNLYNVNSERDDESSKKIIGSSVVTSVSVILNGNEPQFTDAVGHKVPKPQPSLQVASPIDLLNPDRYEFYTFDENGELIKRLMTMEEIQSIVANGDGEGPTIIHSAQIDERDPEKNVHDIVQSVQSVLNKEVESTKNTTSESLPTLDTPDVSSSWSMILPAIFGNTGVDIFPQQKPQQIVMTPDSELLDVSTKTTPTSTKKQKPSKRKPGQKRKTVTTSTTEMTPQVVQEELDPSESVYTGMQQYQNIASNMQNFEGFSQMAMEPIYHKIPDVSNLESTTRRVFVNNQEIIKTNNTTKVTDSTDKLVPNENLSKKPPGVQHKRPVTNHHKTPSETTVGTKRPQINKQKIKKKPQTTVSIPSTTESLPISSETVSTQAAAHIKQKTKKKPPTTTTPLPATTSTPLEIINITTAEPTVSVSTTEVPDVHPTTPKKKKKKPTRQPNDDITKPHVNAGGKRKPSPTSANIPNRVKPTHANKHTTNKRPIDLTSDSTVHQKVTTHKVQHANRPTQNNQHRKRPSKPQRTTTALPVSSNIEAVTEATPAKVTLTDNELSRITNSSFSTTQMASTISAATTTSLSTTSTSTTTEPATSSTVLQTSTQTLSSSVSETMNKVNATTPATIISDSLNKYNTKIVLPSLSQINNEKKDEETVKKPTQQDEMDLDAMMAFDQIMQSLTEDVNKVVPESPLIDKENQQKQPIAQSNESLKTDQTQSETSKVNKTQISSDVVTLRTTDYKDITEEVGMEDTTVSQEENTTNSPIVLITARPQYFANKRQPEVATTNVPKLNQRKTEEEENASDTLTTTFNPIEALTDDDRAQIIKFEQLYADMKDPILTDLEITTTLPMEIETQNYQMSDKIDTSTENIFDTTYQQNLNDPLLRLPVRPPPSKPDIFDQDFEQATTEYTPLVADLKPHLNLNIIKPTDKITMSSFQTHAATVASALLDGTNSASTTEYINSSNEGNSELDLLISDVLQQIKDDDNFKPIKQKDEGNKRYTNEEIAHQNVTFIGLDPHSLVKEASYEKNTDSKLAAVNATEIIKNDSAQTEMPESTEADMEQTTIIPTNENLIEAEQNYFNSIVRDEITTETPIKEDEQITTLKTPIDDEKETIIETIKFSTTESVPFTEKLEDETTDQTLTTLSDMEDDNNNLEMDISNQSNQRNENYTTQANNEKETIMYEKFKYTTPQTPQTVMSTEIDSTEKMEIHKNILATLDTNISPQTLQKDEEFENEHNTEQSTTAIIDSDDNQNEDEMLTTLPPHQPVSSDTESMEATQNKETQSDVEVTETMNSSSEQMDSGSTEKYLIASDESASTEIPHETETTEDELIAVNSAEETVDYMTEIDPYIKLGEHLAKPVNNNITIFTGSKQHLNETDNKTVENEEDVEEVLKPLLYSVPISEQPDAEDEEDQNSQNIPVGTKSTSTSTTVTATSTPTITSSTTTPYATSTTTKAPIAQSNNTLNTSTMSPTIGSITTRRPPTITTRRIHTLKPVSYYKQPTLPLFNLADPQKVNTFSASNLPQQRPMHRPAALTNLMAASTQATRPPVKLEPSPTSSKGLEASVKHLDPDVLEFSRLCNELAFNYWKSITSEKISSARSLVLSPFALTSMLSMVFLGARGGTSGEMNEVLRLDDMVTFNPHLVFKNVTDSVERAYDSDIATAAFVREIFSDRANGKILQFFKEKTQQFYGGHVEEVNFNVVNDIIRRRTNLLMKRHTMGKVLEYLRTNSVWVNGPLATISANLYQTDCRHGSTKDRDGEMFFQVHPTARQRRLVPIPAVLYKSGFTAGYEPRLDVTVVAFGQLEDTVSTIFVMPGHQSSISSTDNLDRMEKDLVEFAFSKNAWSNLLTALMDHTGMEVQLPRFSHRSFVNASLGLQKMGLKRLFKSEFADLRGLTGTSSHDIYLSDMIQINTFSTCGEEKISEHHHVEMYPAPPLRKRNKDVDAIDDEFDSSESIIDFGSLVQDSALGRGFYDDLLDPKYLELPLPLRPRQARVPDAPRLRFDKPFLYFVRHNPTGMILFMGRFNPRLLP